MTRFQQRYHAINFWIGRFCLSVLLLGMRVVWGYAFYVAGKGKLAKQNRLASTSRMPRSAQAGRISASVTSTKSLA